MNTRYYKDMRGSQAAETSVDIEGGRMIRITTMKRSNGSTMTTACAGVADGHFFTYAPFSDYNGNFGGSNGRCTAKLVKELHESVLENIDSIIYQCKQFYAKEAA